MMTSPWIKNLARRLKWYVNARNYKLVELEDYAAKVGLQVETIIPESTIHSDPPRFFGGNCEIDLSIYDGKSMGPEVNLIKIPNAIAVGRSEFVIKDGMALYPRLFDVNLYTFMLEIEGRAQVTLKSSRITMALRSRVKKSSSVISLLGQCNGNYAHWVLEVLTRLAFVETMPALKGLPLLVDDPGHEVLRSALHALNKSGRHIIFVENAQKVEAETIFFLTSPSFTPPETRRFFEKGEIDVPREKQFCFSPKALWTLRNFFTQEIADFYLPITANETLRADMSAVCPLVYIPRKPGTTGNGRHIENARPVEALLVERDFSIIDTSAISFTEQILALKGAKVVVSAAGASLVNLVFCEPGVRVVLLSPQYRDANWFYWTNLMAALGHHLYIVLGPQVGDGGSQIYHRDFRVSLSLLDAAVTEALEEAGFSGGAKSTIKSKVRDREGAAQLKGTWK